MTALPDGDPATQSQRLDKWLWQARFFKTRTIAAKYVSDGKVRITRGDNTLRIDKPSAAVRPGDVLVFTRNERLRIIHILACGVRRGPAKEAQSLYEDQSPPPPRKSVPKPTPFAREKGAGRPTKKDRRALAALKSAE
ncbi:MAG: RNA-binding S4 domain-containing protein [Pseudomonadota bacterium]